MTTQRVGRRPGRWVPGDRGSGFCEGPRADRSRRLRGRPPGVAGHSGQMERGACCWLDRWSVSALDFRPPGRQPLQAVPWLPVAKGCPVIPSESASGVRCGQSQGGGSSAYRVVLGRSRTTQRVAVTGVGSLLGITGQPLALSVLGITGIRRAASGVPDRLPCRRTFSQPQMVGHTSTSVRGVRWI